MSAIFQARLYGENNSKKPADEIPQAANRILGGVQK
jgi:hypothetical protein